MQSSLQSRKRERRKYDSNSVISLCGNDRGSVPDSGDPARGIYGQPVCMAFKAEKKYPGGDQGIIRKKKGGDFAKGDIGSTVRPGNDRTREPLLYDLRYIPGAVLSRRIPGNSAWQFLLAPVMAVGFLFLPFWYVKLTASHYKRDVSAELETALSVITTAYLRTEDIVTAVEENIAY